MTSDHVKISFTLDPNDWHGTSVETLWARPVHAATVPSAFELDNSPFHVKGVSHCDVIRAVERGGALEFAGVIARSGRSTYRVLFDRGTDMFREWWSRLQALGCTYEGADIRGKKLFSIDVPPEADIYAVYAILEEGEAQNVWEFEEGHVGHRLRDAPTRSIES